MYKWFTKKEPVHEKPEEHIDSLIDKLNNHTKEATEILQRIKDECTIFSNLS